MQGLFSILALASFMTSCVLGNMSQKDKDDILEIHNKFRGMEGASNMAEMVWDNELENEATRWAANCMFQHEGGTRDKDQGENLYFASWKTGDKNKKLIVDGMESWYAEKKDYRWNAQNCGPTGSCHYTQIVWADTKKVGCAAKICRPLGNSGWSKESFFLVCRYSSVGNWMGEDPYMKGQACSDCKGFKCKNGLCQGGGGGAPCEDKNEDCAMWTDMGECDNNPKFMKRSCKKSCGLCKGGGGNGGGGGGGKPQGNCKDSNPSCADWAARGECNRNPGYMKRSCKKSCRTC